MMIIDIPIYCKVSGKTGGKKKNRNYLVEKGKVSVKINELVGEETITNSYKIYNNNSVHLIDGKFFVSIDIKNGFINPFLFGEKEVGGD